LVSPKLDTGNTVQVCEVGGYNSEIRIKLVFFIHWHNILFVGVKSGKWFG